MLVIVLVMSVVVLIASNALFEQWPPSLAGGRHLPAMPSPLELAITYIVNMEL